MTDLMTRELRRRASAMALLVLLQACASTTTPAPDAADDAQRYEIVYGIRLTADNPVARTTAARSPVPL